MRQVNKVKLSTVWGGEKTKQRKQKYMPVQSRLRRKEMSAKRDKEEEEEEQRGEVQQSVKRSKSTGNETQRRL